MVFKVGCVCASVRVCERVVCRWLVGFEVMCYIIYYIYAWGGD